jgi:mono/diheme cytochrome c family protein
MVDWGTVQAPARLRARRLRSVGASVCIAAVLASCGGAREDQSRTSDSTAAADTGSTQRRALALPVPDNAPADAKQKGLWSALYNWPIIPIHAVLMPDGRVMTYGSKPDGASTAFFGLDLWDNTGAPDVGHLSLANGTGNDVFCSSQLLLPPQTSSAPPTLFMAGGDAWNGTTSSFVGIPGTTEFNAASNTLTRGVAMSQPRWYSTAITLVSGETYIQGGAGGAANPDVRQLDGSIRKLSTANTGFLAWSYPRNYVMPDGRVFGYDFEGRMYFVDTAGTGAISPRPILPLQYFGIGTSAMFRPGRILQVGGNTNGAAIIDVTSGVPAFTPTQSISSNRKLMTATLLADGRVLVTGGSPVWNELPGANRTAEIWDPTTGQWSVGAEQARPRLYHSTALLLPDATVLVGGGGAPAPNGGPPGGERNVEVYFPPYLFTASGGRAARPTVATAPDWLELGSTFAMQTTGTGVSRVTLVKTGSVTHGWNFDQRFLDLTFTRSATGVGGSALAVNAPTRPGEATPGYYMLFVFDDAGVPSQARIVRVGIAGAANANAPTLANPGALSTTLGAAQNWLAQGRDPNSVPLTYSAAGLPPGVAINRSTGQVTGAPSAVGSFNVVLGVTDGRYSATSSFVWTVKPQTPLTLTQAPAPGASLAGVSAAFSAGATGQGTVEYSWTFGDGSAATAWSANPNIYKAFASPGTYSVTLRIRDASGTVVSRTFLQTVYLGSADPRPTASTTLLMESTVNFRDRVWVVNQDNDSITGFDPVTNSKLGEITVGAGPRSIALASTGLLWVTNKFDASISIVSPDTRQVLRRVDLPRASQPHGVAISPTAPQAFVVLEATGQLLRIDTNTYAVTGSLSVGPNVRHVSVAGNGRTVYVTRFITPPLPGEATAAVATPADRGGEVLQVDAAAMTLTRTIVLKHSDVSDAENQGSGVPNYLGPFTMSPDNSQGFVPGKQDNIKRGTLRNGQALNFQNSVRAVSSRIPLTGAGAGQEDQARRIDHDNASLASAVAYDTRGVLMFVALETSREVAIVDAHSGAQLTRFDVGRAPQGLALSSDGYTLYVNNFMDRSVSVHDLRPLLVDGVAQVRNAGVWQAVTIDKLSPTVLLGKQLFYDARDTRLARDRYMSCASCHNDGGHDGRVWDFTSLGEGLRNTVALRGRVGAQGRLHWSANFDEVQDFEGQIRTLSGGSGLMSDTQFNAGTRSQPLGDRKAGISADLDALAAYVTSLASFAPSPLRAADGSLTAEAAAGKQVFQASCLACHGTAAYTTSGTVDLQNIGTLKPSSGKRLFGPLTGIDPPTLRDAWATAPYLHDGSAATLQAAIAAHNGITLSGTQLAQVAAFVAQIGAEEPDAGTAPAGTGLTGAYYNNITLSGTPVLTRREAVDFSSAGFGAPGVNLTDYSVRWSGKVVLPASGSTVFQTVSDDGVRLWINGQLVVDNWTYHGPTTDTAPAFNGNADQQVDVVMEYFQSSGGAVARLLWKPPGAAAFVPVPAARLLPGANVPLNRPPAVTAIAPQTATVGTPRTLQVQAWDLDRDTLGYAATGLPPGLNINPANGLIGGTPTTAGSFNVQVTVSDGRGGATSRGFSWAVQAAVTPGGLNAAYYNNRSFAGTPAFTAKEAVDFVWGTGSRLPGVVSADNITVRWSGKVIVPASGAYVFGTESDDGVRLWVRGVLVIDNWTDHARTLNTSAAVTLAAGEAADIVMEFYEAGGDAVARLLWQPPGAAALVPIPASQLGTLAGP